MKSFTFIILFFCAVSFVCGSRSDKVKLQDVQVLTLKANRMTTGRRSAPVPQLKCLGNCHATLPHVVQCVNKGWDGSNVQWECKAEMEEGYKFDDLAVICEGYDYPDDPYILAGSCGLEYTLRTGKKSSSYEDQKPNYGWQQNLHQKSKKSGFDSKNLVVFLVLAGIIYALYKTCLAGPYENPTAQQSTTNGDFPPDDAPRPNMGWNIPGMGSSRRGYTGGYGDDASCGTGQRGARGAGGLGGFWTGLATGGLAGYMFGNRGGQQQGYRSTPSTGSSFFGSSQPSYGSSQPSYGSSQPSYGSSQPSYSSSSRSSTSTGFAETRRR